MTTPFCPQCKHVVCEDKHGSQLSRPECGRLDRVLTFTQYNSRPPADCPLRKEKK